MRLNSAWHGVELRHLTALEAVAAERSFSAAASRLGYTQSAISGQIQALERAVGARLFERIRGSRPVRLTEEGKILLAHASAISGRLALAQAEIAAVHAGTSKTVTVGVTRTVSRALVPETLRRLTHEDPDADVAVRELYDFRKVMEELEQGTIDLAVTPLPMREGPFDSTPVYRDEHVLVVRRSDPLAARPWISLDELCELPVIAVDECRAQSAAEDAVAAAGRRLKVCRRLEDAASILAFVSAGLGVGFLPALAVDLPPDLVAVELDRDVPPRLIAIAWLRDGDLSTRAMRFVELAADVGRSLSERPALQRAI